MPTSLLPRPRASAALAALAGALCLSAPSAPAAAAPAPPGPAAAAAAGRTAFGAVVSPRRSEDRAAALARAERDYGRLAVIRDFDRDLPDPWPELRTLLTDHAAIVSFKLEPREVLSGSYDAQLRRWFATAPTTRTTWWSYRHEPEDNIARGSFTAAQFRAAFAHISALAAKVDNPSLKATLILQCYTANPNSGRRFADYYPGGAAVDVIGWDCYNHKTKVGTYGSPETLTGKAIELSRSVGKPWGIAELGSTKVKTDPGQGRADWLTRSARYLYDQGATFVSYFDTAGAGTDYRLLDEPSRKAWHDVVSDQRP